MAEIKDYTDQWLQAVADTHLTEQRASLDDERRRLDDEIAKLADAKEGLEAQISRVAGMPASAITAMG